MKFTAIKTVNGYQASGDDKVPMNAMVMIEFVKKRNYENHKRFFQFVNETFDMQGFFEDKDVYRKWLQMKAGAFKSVVTPKGETIFLPDSISFEKMDEVEFQKIFSKCINAFINELGNGISREELDRIVLGYG